MSDLLVLCYHAVSERWPAALSITPKALDAQLATLARRGYRGGRFTESIAEPQPALTVVVTFDDNYRSVLELAKPILDRHGFPATIFVPTAWPDDPRPMTWPGIHTWHGTEHEAELRSLRWEELRQLVAEGWEVGSHTCSHPHMTQLDDAELARELSESKAKIEAELDHPCTSIAYPYGDVDDRVEHATEAAGYVAAGSIPRVLHRPRPMRWPRAPIYHDDASLRFSLKVSPALRMLRASPAMRLIDEARVAYLNRRRSFSE